ncbi:MAG: hypothetical protein ACRCZ5_13710, partial [Burkholderiales bacterium]
PCWRPAILKEALSMKRILLAVWISSSLSQAAQARELADWVKLSGFGTLGVVHSNDKGADYHATLEPSTGAGRSNALDSGVDSVLGVQADLQLGQNLSGTAQVVSRRLSDYNSSRPYFEWANLKYQITPNLYLRGGRIVAPMFFWSDSRMVGYAQTSVRPWGEVYLMNPITYLNGVDLGYLFKANNVLYRVGAATGKMSQTLYSNSTQASLNYRFDNTLFNLAAEYAGSTLRLGYARVDMSTQADAISAYENVLNALIANNNQTAAVIKDNVTFSNVKSDFYNIAYRYDHGPWLLQAEWARRRMGTDGIADIDGFGLLGGYRIGDWTPYLQYARTSHKGPPALPLLSGPGAALVNGLNAQFQLRLERSNIGAGVRWDVIDNVALKLQFERIDKPAGGNGFFINSTDDFTNNRRQVNLYSATLDFVF